VNQFLAKIVNLVSLIAALVAAVDRVYTNFIRRCAAAVRPRRRRLCSMP